jgi:hypothetical protein
MRPVDAAHHGQADRVLANQGPNQDQLPQREVRQYPEALAATLMGLAGRVEASPAVIELCGTALLHMMK